MPLGRSQASGSPPSFEATGPQIALVDEVFELQIVAVPSDPASGIDYGLQGHPVGMSIDASGLIRWDRPSLADVGFRLVEVLATDDSGQMAAKSISLEIVASGAEGAESGQEAPVVPGGVAEDDALAVARHHVVSTELRISPVEVFTPKSIPGSVEVSVVAAGGHSPGELESLQEGAFIEGHLRGPGLPGLRVLGVPGQRLMLPPLAVPGDYVLEDVRLVDEETREVLLYGTPYQIPVHVFPEVLITRVEARPLTYDEVAERGIFIDSESFSVVEFQAMFLVQGRERTVKFPIVRPRFVKPIEFIPEAEVFARIAEAESINREMEQPELPQELRVPGLDIQMMGVNFQRVRDGIPRETVGDGLTGLVVIPGRIGFLNQFFDVQVYVTNGSPSGSGLSVHQVEAEIVLPVGSDQVAGTEDDPLVMARLGGGSPQSVRVPVRTAGADKQSGTFDDGVRFQPGETGVGEFLVEGRTAGRHEFDIHLSGVLDGLGHGEVDVESVAPGSILVRNPKFSVVFGHPDRVRVDEPYEVSMTIMNTSETVADEVSVSLVSPSISGARLAADEEEQKELGSLQPGQAKTVTYALVALRTGRVLFNNFTGDDNVSGRFDLRTGVDERGVTLSSTILRYPAWVRELPPDVFSAADRVLGQSLAISTAALLPPGISPMRRQTVRRRAIELAEAGQRLRYGDAPEVVYLDLLLDWMGARSQDEGFEQILRTTNAGSSFVEAIVAAIEAEGTDVGGTAIRDEIGSLAGRHRAMRFVVTQDPWIEPSVSLGQLRTSALESRVPETLAFRGDEGWVLPVLSQTSEEMLATFKVPAHSAGGTVSLITIDGTGSAMERTFTLPATSDSEVCFDAYLDAEELIEDAGCAEHSTAVLAGASQSHQETPPDIVAAIQDLEPRVGRPPFFCGGPQFERLGQTYPYGNYGTVVALLFSKPMAETEAQAEYSARLTNGAAATGMAIQPGGRVALLNLSQAVGTLRDQELDLEVDGFVDLAGLSTPARLLDVAEVADQGVQLDGRVIGRDGLPAAGLPVTLTMLDRSGESCRPGKIRTSQVLTEEDGGFSFGFVTGGIPYLLGATDTRSLDAEAAAILAEASPTGALDPEAVARFADEPAMLARLEEAFGQSVATESMAILQGVDRATFRDYVSLESPRMGQTVPVVLKFRGRASVRGQVVAGDATPVENAAVNLFPDSTSREKGRGVFTDQNGRFSFEGVPLGLFTVDAQTSDGRRSVTSDFLGESGATKELNIVLTDTTVYTGEVQGWMYEADGSSPHSNGFVYALQDNAQGPIVGAARTDQFGFFSISNLPVGSVAMVAVSSNETRRTAYQSVQVIRDGVSYANLSLEGLETVSGLVSMPNGTPVEGALVAGGESIVLTDENGEFITTGVPTGNRQISVGIYADHPLARGFPRLAQERLNVAPGRTNYVSIVLPSQGRIAGTVLDAAGMPQASTQVVIPGQTGFAYTYTDEFGDYAFSPWSPGRRAQVTASVIPLPVDRDVIETFDEAVQTRDVGQIQSAASSVFALYATSFIREEEPPQGRFGFSYAEVTGDGVTAVANIQYLNQGTVEGRVENPDGVPIGASLELRALVRDDRGAIKLGDRATGMSDLSSGRFEFTGIPVGPYAITARSPFFSRPVVHQGQMSDGDLLQDGIVLRFVEDAEPAHLSGTVTRDGSPVGAGVSVRIPRIAWDYEIMTDSSGRFDTLLELDQGVYTISADDGTREGQVTRRLWAGEQADIVVPLVPRSSSLTVSVVTGAQSPAMNADVRVSGRSFPRQVVEQTATSGQTTFSNLYEGDHAVRACATVGQLRFCGNEVVSLVSGAHESVEILIGEFGSIEGEFVEVDGTTIVPFAQVEIGSTGFATTDISGSFVATEIPLGTHKISARNPTTGRYAEATATLTYQGEIAVVTLQELPFGTVMGRVFDTDQTSVIGGQLVSLDPSNPAFPQLEGTTDSDGWFRFTTVPPGNFWLKASRRVGHDNQTALESGAMPSAGGLEEIDLHFPLRVTKAFELVDSAGVRQPGRVRVGSTWAQTGTTGLAMVGGLQESSYQVYGNSTAPLRSRSRGRTNFSIQDSTDHQTIETIELSGVGSVQIDIKDATGAPLPSNADIELRMRPSQYYPGADDTLRFAATSTTVPNIAIGDVFVSATYDGVHAASGDGEVTSDGQLLTFDLQMSASATVTGTLLRADGTTPFVFQDVVLTYDSPGGYEGLSIEETDANGEFRFSPIPVGPVTLSVFSNTYDASLIIDEELTFAREVLNLGDLVVDEQRPTIDSIHPADGAREVPVAVSVEVVFSEEMDPHSLMSAGAYVADQQGGRIPAVSSLATEPVSGEDRILVITPDQPLDSLTTYTVVISGETAYGTNGSVLGTGPTDLAGKTLSAISITSFTTRDDDPPQLLSQSPMDEAEQVAVGTPLRFTFDEPMDETSFAASLQELGGPSIATTKTLLLGGQVAVFKPNQPLELNKSYTWSLTGAEDRAGNSLLDLPLSGSFATVDTLGPVVNNLILHSASQLSAGSQVQMRAELAEAEIGYQIQGTADLIQFRRSSLNSSVFPLLVPASTGSLNVKARGIDRFGNYGPWYEEAFNVVANQPPTLVVQRMEPSSGPLVSGEDYRFVVVGSDESAVSETKAELSGAFIASASKSDGQLSFEGVVPDSVGANSSVTLTATVTDNSGLSTSSTPLVMAIVDGVRPSVDALTLTPDRIASVEEDFSVAFSASDSFGLSSVVVTFNHELPERVLSVAPGSTSFQDSIQVSLPSDLPIPTHVDVAVRATDQAGLTSVLTKNVYVEDNVAPALSGSDPMDGELGIPTNSDLVVSFSERLESSSVTGSHVYLVEKSSGSVVSATLRTSTSFGFHVIIEPAADLQPLTTYEIHATTGLEDLSGNGFVGTVLEFQTTATPGGPMLTHFEPSDGAKEVDIRDHIAVYFDRPLAASSVSDDMLTVVDSSSVAVPRFGSVQLVDGDRGLEFSPLGLLSLGEQYTVRVDGSLTDVYGDAVRDQTGLPFSGIEASFQTLSATITVPGGDRVIENHDVEASIVSDQGLNFGSVTWYLDGTSVSGWGNPNALPIPSASQGPSSTVEIGARTNIGYGLAYIKSRVFDIVAWDDDADGDSMSNGTEVSFGLDPFDASDYGLDPDLDGLANHQEVAVGTDPFDEDSDDDGLLDGVDPEPMNGNRPPVVGKEVIEQRAAYLPSTNALQLLPAHRLQAPFTIEFSIYPSSSTGSVLFSSGANGALELSVDPVSEELQVGLKTVDDTTQRSISTGMNAFDYFSTTRRSYFHRVALVMSETELLVYVDGNLLAREPAAADLDYALGGAYEFPLSMVGYVADLRVWSQARTQGQLQGWMARRLRLPTSGLVSAFHFDDVSSSSTVALDVSGNGHHLPISSLWTNYRPETVGDASVNTNGHSVDLRFDTYDFDGDSMTLEVVSFPSHGRIFSGKAGSLRDEILPSSPDVYHREIYYMVDSGYVGDDFFSVRADDGHEGSLIDADVRVATEPSKMWTGLDATDPTDWSRPDNWSPVGVPQSDDSVLIPTPGGTTGPVMASGNIHIGSLTIEAGAELVSSSGAINVHGAISNQGVVSGAGRMRLYGHFTEVSGSFGDLTIWRDASLDGDLYVSGDLDLGSDVEIGQYALEVGGDFHAASGHGALHMSDARGEVTVEGNIEIAVLENLQAGTIRCRGDLEVVQYAGITGEDLTLIIDGLQPQLLDGVMSEPPPTFGTLHIKNTQTVTIRDHLAARQVIIDPNANVVVEAYQYPNTKTRFEMDSLDLGAGASLQVAQTLRVRDQALIGGGASVTAGVLQMPPTSLPASASVSTSVFEHARAGPLPTDIPFDHLSISERLDLASPLHVTGDVLVVGPTGVLKLNGFAAEVDGDMVLEHGAVEMTSASDELIVHGLFSTVANQQSSVFAGDGRNGSCGVIKNSWLDGRMRFTGDRVAISYPCAPSGGPMGGSHEVELAPPPAVTMELTGRDFQNLHILGTIDLKNRLHVQGDLEFDGSVVTLPERSLVVDGDLSMAAGSVLKLYDLRVDGEFSADSTASLDTRYARLENALSLPGTFSVDDWFYLGGTVELPALSMPGRIMVTQGTVSLGGALSVGMLTVEGDANLDLQGATLTSQGAVTVYGGLELASGRLVALDTLTINGACPNQPGGSRNLTGGTIEASKNVSFGSSSCKWVMAPGVELRMKGTTVQWLTLSYGRSQTYQGSSLGDLVIDNVAGVYLSGNAWVEGDMTVSVGADPTFTTLHVEGDLTIPSGSSLTGSTLSLRGPNNAIAGVLDVSRRLVIGGQTAVVPATLQHFDDLEIETNAVASSDVDVTDLSVLSGSFDSAGYSVDAADMTISAGASAVAGGPVTLTGYLDVHGSLTVSDSLSAGQSLRLHANSSLTVDSTASIVGTCISYPPVSITGPYVCP